MWSTISAQAKPATECPAWKASGPVPPWGVDGSWRLKTLIDMSGRRGRFALQ
ncbi:MAG: hypothetical protein ACLSHC_10835 [Bilophila wadsworthia]